MEIEGYSDLVSIGAGGNARVYSARDSDGHEVAIKVLHGGGDEAVARRFGREVRLMEAVRDVEGLVPTLDSGTTATGDPFLVMPLFAGGSLADLLGTPMAWRAAATHVRDVALALAAAHDRDILHLDVKPANVLLDDAGRPWLGDFGIAEAIGSTASMSGAMLTPAYTPPERLRGEKPSKATDVYGLGATLFALASGTAPFGATTKRTNPAAVMMAVLNDPVPLERLPEDVPAELVQLIERSMSKDPQPRVGSAHEVARLLDSVLGHEGADATIAGPSSLDRLRSPGEVKPDDRVESSIEEDPSATVAAPSESARVSNEPSEPAVQRGRRRWLLVAALLVVVLVSVVVFVRPDDTPVETSAPSAAGSSTPTTIDPALAGTTVRVLTNASNEEVFEAVLQTVSLASGIEVELRNTSNTELFTTTLDGADPPGIVVTSPSFDNAQRCADGRFVPADAELEAVLRAQHHEALLIRAGDAVCGAALAAIPDFLIWYNPNAMQAWGYEVPSTWNELDELTQRMVTDGFTPWCIGFEAGTASGFPGQQWIDNLLVQSASLEVYDGLFDGSVSWSHPEVEEAFGRFEEVIADDKVRGGRRSISRTSFDGSYESMFRTRPGCFFHAAGSGFETQVSFLENPPQRGVDYDFIPFPALEGSGDRAVVRTRFVAATNDRPETRAALAYLLSAEGQEELVAAGGITANVVVDPELVSDDWDRRLMETMQNADDVRVSGNGLISESLSAEWSAQMVLFANESVAADQVAAALDAAIVRESGR